MGAHEKVIEHYAKVLTVKGGFAGGDKRTVVSIDRLLPANASGAVSIPFSRSAADGKTARWHLHTSSKQRPLRLPKNTVRSGPLQAFHTAAPEKGRRVVVTDLVAGQTAALLAWHFEEGTSGSKLKRNAPRRPHLVVSAAVRDDAEAELRGAYSSMLLHLFLFVAAVDRTTVARGRIGVREVGAVLLTRDELRSFGLKPGPSRKKGGHWDSDYWELTT